MAIFDLFDGFKSPKMITHDSDYEKNFEISNFFNFAKKILEFEICNWLHCKYQRLPFESWQSKVFLLEEIAQGKSIKLLLNSR